MSLTPATAAAALTNACLLIEGINADGTPSGNPSTGNFAAAFADGYDTYAKAGLVPGAANSGGSKALLQTALEGLGSTPVQTLAQAFADYWATVAVDPGDPAHGGTSVVSVVNDAAAHVADFAAAITASLTTTESAPYFESFVANIEAVVKTITWTVTELVGAPPVPVAFTEAIA